MLLPHYKDCDRGSENMSLFVQNSTPSCARKKRKKGNHKRRDYPKKALSAYNIFFKETREKILTEHGKTNFQEMVRKVAALWKEITPEDKLRFDAIASRDLFRYKREVSEYEQYIVEKSQKQSIGDEEKRKKKKEINMSAMLPPSVVRPISIDVDVMAQRESEDDKAEIVCSVQSNESTATRTDESRSDNSGFIHTLTSNELQSAHHHLNEVRHPTKNLLSTRKQQIDLSCLNRKETILSKGILAANQILRRDNQALKLSSMELELYRRDILKMKMKKERTAARGEEFIGNRIALDLHNGRTITPIDHELNIKHLLVQANHHEKELGLDEHTRSILNEINRTKGLVGNTSTVAYGLKSREPSVNVEDCTVSSKRMRLAKHLNTTQIDPAEAKVKDLVSEAFKMSQVGASDMTRNCTSTLDGMELRKHLRRGNQRVRSNEFFSRPTSAIQTALKSFTAGNQDLINSRETGMQKPVVMNDLQNQSRPTDVGFQKHLVMLRRQELLSRQLARSFPNTIRIGHQCNRDMSSRQQERLPNGLSVGASTSTGGGFSSGETIQSVNPRLMHPLLYGRMLSDLVSDHCRGQTDTQPVFTQSQLSLLGMVRMKSPPKPGQFDPQHQFN